MIGEGEAFPIDTQTALPPPQLQSVTHSSDVPLPRRPLASLRDNLTSAADRDQTMSAAAIDEAMKSVLPALEMRLSPSLESALTTDADHSFEVYDQLLADF